MSEGVASVPRQTGMFTWRLIPKMPFQWPILVHTHISIAVIINSLFQINVLKSIEDLDKSDLLRILDFIENTLKVHWQDHEGFMALQERVLALRMILEEAGDKPLEGNFPILYYGKRITGLFCFSNSKHDNIFIKFINLHEFSFVRRL